jgi:hypothetical protein
MATKGHGPGGFREGSGRKSLFPGKRDIRIGKKVTVQLTNVAINAAEKKAQDLTDRKPDIAAAEHVNVVTFSDAVEYCIRRATNTPLED